MMATSYDERPLPNPPHKGEGLTRSRRLFQEWGGCHVGSPPFGGSEGRGETCGSTPVSPAGQRGACFKCNSPALVGDMPGRAEGKFCRAGAAS